MVIDSFLPYIIHSRPRGVSLVSACSATLIFTICPKTQICDTVLCVFFTMEQWSTYMKISIVCLFLFFICSCGAGQRITYDGPQKPLSEVAVINGEYSSGYGQAKGIQFVGLDMKRFPHFSEYPKTIQVLPGHHHLTVSYWDAKSGKAKHAYTGVEIFVQAGETYVVKYTLDSRFNVWIVNVRTQEIVSKPSTKAVEPTMYGWH
jgi:hypothetical protein